MNRTTEQLTIIFKKPKFAGELMKQLKGANIPYYRNIKYKEQPEYIDLFFKTNNDYDQQLKQRLYMILYNPEIAKNIKKINLNLLTNL